MNGKTLAQAKTRAGGWGRAASAAENQSVVNAISKINREVGFRSLTDARSKIVSGSRLERMRSELEDEINDTLAEIQPRMVALVLGQVTGTMEGGMGGFIPAYRGLSPKYLLRKKAIAQGKRRVKTKTTNYLRRHPNLADGFFVYSGETLRSLKRTAGTMPNRLGRAQVTFKTQFDRQVEVRGKTRIVKSKVKLPSRRGQRVGEDFEAETYKQIIGSFRITYFGRLSMWELAQIYGYDGARNTPDKTLPATLFNNPISLRLAGGPRSPNRPFVLPTLAFYAQKRVPQVIDHFVQNRAQTLLYDRANPRTRRPR